MTLLLTTVNTITVTELIDTTNVGAVFTHPVVDENLLDKWSTDEIRAAASLQTALDSGDVTMTYAGARITDLSLFGLGAGRLYNAIRSITTADTLSFEDEIVVYRGVTAETITLPDPTDRFGENITVKNASPNTIVIATLGGAIDGFSTVNIEGVIYASITFVSDGTDWLAI